MNAVVQTQSFEEKMRTRIKDSIGDLIDDATLTTMCERAMEDLFFKERTVSDGRWDTKKIPPLLHEILKPLLAERVDYFIQKWVSEHEDQVKATMELVVKEGVGTAYIHAMNSLFRTDMAMLEANITSRLMSMRNGNG